MNNENKKLDNTFLRKIIVSLVILLVSIFSFIKNDIRVDAADTALIPQVKVEGTYGENHTVSDVEGGIYTESRGGNPVVKITISNIDRRIYNIKVGESGSGADYNIAYFDGATEGCYPCNLHVPTGVRTLTSPAPLATNGVDGAPNIIELYYIVQQNEYGIKNLFFEFFAHANYESADNYKPLLIEPVDKFAVVVKELNGGPTYFEPDEGDYAARETAAAYTIGTRGGNMTDIDGHYFLNILTYSGGNEDGVTPTNKPIQINLGAIKDIAIAELKITRNVLGEDPSEPLTVSWTGGDRDFDTGVVTAYTFNTGNFVNVNGYYDLVVTDVFGYTHTLTFVIDAITVRNISIELEYYLEEVLAGRLIVAEQIDEHWFNKDIVIKAIISTDTTAPFVADDIFASYGGTFTVNSNVANVTKEETNYTIHGYQFNNTYKTFEVLITVKQNEDFEFSFTDRYGNKLNDHNKSIEKIDKEAPVIYKDSTEGTIISNVNSASVATQTISINASTMYNNIAETLGFIANFTNSYLLGTSGVTLTSGTFKLIGEDRPTDSNAGFHTSGTIHSYYITYRKSDNDNTLIGTINGVNTVISTGVYQNIIDTVSEELFKGNSIIIEIILQDYFPLVDTILNTTVDGRLHGNPTYAKVEVNVVDDVKPIIFSKTEPTILSQQAGETKSTRYDMLTNYVDYIWDNSIEDYKVKATEFTFSGDTAIASGITVTVTDNIDILTPKKYHSIFVNAKDVAGNSAEQKTYDYEVTRRKVLVEITGSLEKTYGEADDLKVVSFVTPTGYKEPLTSYGFGSRSLFRETGKIGDYNYQDALPNTLVYKLYQYWVQGGSYANYDAKETAMLAVIANCNAMIPTETCTNGFVNDSNHDIDFKIGEVIYDTLELYYSREEATADVNGSVLSASNIGYKINTSETITITPDKSEYRTTYGTDIVYSQLTYTIGGTVESNTNYNPITQTYIFAGNEHLTTDDPKNVTKAEGINSDNDGFLKLSLVFDDNAWGGYNYDFASGNQFDTEGYYIEDSARKQMIFIDQATLTATPYLGQYKDIDSIFDNDIKVQGHDGVNSDGILKSNPTTVEDKTKYLFSVSGWQHDDGNDGSAGHSDARISGILRVGFDNPQRVKLLGNGNYDGYNFNIGTLVYNHNGYNNYKFVLDGDFTNPSDSEIDKKFVITKVQITIATNNFEMTYGDTITLFNLTAGNQGTITNFAAPAFRIYRTGNETIQNANALKAGGVSDNSPINTLEDLKSSIVLNLTDFEGIERIPSGVYALIVAFNENNTNNVRDNFDFTFVNEGTLEVKSKTVYVTADGSYTKVYGDADEAPALGVYSTVGGETTGLVDGDTLENAFNPIFTSGGNKVYIERTASENVGNHNFLPATAVANANTNNPVYATYGGYLVGKSGKTFADYRIADDVDTHTNYTAVASTVTRTYTITKAPITATALNITKVYGDHDKTATIVGDTPAGRLVNKLLVCTVNGACDYPYVLNGIIKTDGNIFVNYGTGETSIDDDPSGTSDLTNVVTGKLSRTVGEVVATYSLANGNLAQHANYNLTIKLNDAKLQITKRPITVHGHNYICDNKESCSGTSYPENKIEYYNDIVNRTFDFTIVGLATDTSVLGTADTKETVLPGTLKWNTTLNNITLNIVQTIYNLVADGDSAATLVFTAHGAENYTYTYVEGSFMIVPVGIDFKVDAHGKTYGQNDDYIAYSVRFSGNMTDADKTAVFGSTTLPTAVGGYYPLTVEQLAEVKTLFGLEFARNVAEDDVVGTYDIYLKGTKPGYNVYVIDGPTESKTLLNNDAGASVGFKVSDAKFTINELAVKIFAVPHTKVFDNVVPEAGADLNYKLCAAGITELTTDGECTSGWVTNSVTVYKLDGVNRTEETINISDSISLLPAGNVLYRAYNEIELTAQQLALAGTTTIKFKDTEINKLTNYSVTKMEASYIITPKSVTVSTDNKTKIYGQDDPAFTFTVAECVVGHTACPSPDFVYDSAASRATGEDVGEYTLDANMISVVQNSINGYNYEITSRTSGKLTITKRPIVLEVDQEKALFKKTYGDAHVAFINDGFTVATIGEGNMGLAYTDTKAGLGIELFRFSVNGTTQLTEGDADAHEDVGSYPLKFVWTSLDSNYEITYKSTILGVNQESQSPYNTGVTYAINKRTITITVTGDSAFQNVEQTNNTEIINGLKSKLVYGEGNENITVANMPTAVRSDDKLEGSLCYAATTDNNACLEEPLPDFSSPGTYLIIRGKLIVKNDSYTDITDYESKNYVVIIEFGEGKVGTGTLTITADLTDPVFYVGTSKVDSLATSIILDINQVTSFFNFESEANTAKGLNDQDLTRGYDSTSTGTDENNYSFNLRRLFSLQAYDYYKETTNRQTPDELLRWTCEITFGETPLNCNKANYDKVGKYTVTFTVYDLTILNSGDDEPNSSVIEGTLYMIDTENPVTGALNVYDKSTGGTPLDSLTDTTVNTEIKWVSNVDGIFFDVTGGSDNSTQWWHRFSLDGGTTWYDYVSTSELVKVFENVDQGQVSIMVQSYDNRETPAGATLGQWTTTDHLFNDNATFFAGFNGTDTINYNPQSGNPYGDANYGVTRTYTIVVDNTAPALGIVDAINGPTAIEIPIVDELTMYAEAGFNPTDSIVASTRETTTVGYKISIGNPTGEGNDKVGIQSTKIRVLKDGLEVLTASDTAINPEFLTRITNEFDYDGDVFRKHNLYSIVYQVIDNAGNETWKVRTIMVIDLRPTWEFSVEDMTGDQQAAAQSFMETQSYSIGVNTPFTMPNLITVNNTGNNLNLAIRQVIRYEGKEVNEIDTSLPGTYTISYDATGGEHNLAARTLELKLNVLQTQDVSKVVISNVNSNMLLYLTACLGLLFIGLSFSYLTLRKKEN